MEEYTREALFSAIAESGKTFDTEKIVKAYDLAERAHKGALRKSGEEYISHPTAVATILVKLGMDTDSIIGALLHDVVEDTDIRLEYIMKQFGTDVALLVDGVTKLTKIPYSTREVQQAENVRKMLLAMSEDIRVIIIKLADRLHNMRTIEFQPDQKRRDVALETMEVYAPIAHRLGIRAIKDEIEDLSLRELDPVAYKDIEHALDIRKESRERFISFIEERLQERLGGELKNFYIEGRVKSVFGIYRKMYIQGHAFEEIYDIFALRIIVNTVNDCYYALGVIHDLFRPLPGRFKDYISNPKPNMYQSLHSTLVDKEAVPFEVQIRTWDMHYTAELGIAAHWKYKAGLTGKDKLEDKVAWIRQLLESQKDLEDIEDLVHTIKSDLASEEVYVFTPKGDVKSLPLGSTVIDFAYAIHSAVGNRMTGAKVDGRMVPLDYKVKTGEIVDILTTKDETHGPSRDWIKIVRSSEARNKIRAWFKKERREENITEGKAELEREFKRNNITLTNEQMSAFILDIAKKQHCHTADELYAALGYGGIILSRIMPRIKEEYIKQFKTPEGQKTETVIKPKKERQGSSVVKIEGLEHCLVKFSRCCNPVPGDDIIGFITRGFGVSIHKRDCVNIRSAMGDPEQTERLVTASWSDRHEGTFKATIDILSDGRQGVLADVSITLSNMHIPIHELIARELKDKTTSIVLTLGITGLEQLSNIIANLSKISGIIQVIRTSNV